LHRKALRVKSADFAKSGSLFQSFPSALAANITGNVYDRFNRLSGSVLHDQYLLRRLRKGPSKSLKVVSLLQISLT
ncbi:hypothetical protein QK408_31895, partial [Pseudomonas aeruginosa]|nr:hypothetical protein [Pseudomonas aeruginosa]